MVDLLIEFLSNTGFALAGYQNIIMILVGIVLIYLGIELVLNGGIGGGL